MSMKEFWNDDPDLFWAYRFSYYNREKKRMDELNYKAWLHGAYVYEAVSVALSNAFGKSKVEYSKQPYTNKTEYATKTDGQEVNNVVTRLKNRVSQVQEIFNKNSSTATGNIDQKAGEINE